MVARPGLMTAVPDALTAPLVATPIHGPAVLLPWIPDFFSHTFSRISYHAMASSTEQSMCSLPKARAEGGMLRSLAIDLTLFWAIDPAETDAFRMLVVQDFNSVAIMHTDDFPCNDFR